jgi:hypothetical protein
MDFTTITDDKKKELLKMLNEIIEVSENNSYVRNRAEKSINLLTHNITVNDAVIVKNEE